MPIPTRRKPPPPDEIERRLRTAVAEFLNHEEAEITADSRFADDLGADSLDCLEIVMIAEERFAVTIDEAEADPIETFGQLLALVRGKRAAA